MSKMSNLFDQDNMFFTIMGVLFDLIILNVLTLLCCISDRYGWRFVHGHAQRAVAHGPS